MIYYIYYKHHFFLISLDVNKNKLINKIYSGNIILLEHAHRTRILIHLYLIKVQFGVHIYFKYLY